MKRNLLIFMLILVCVIPSCSKKNTENTLTGGSLDSETNQRDKDSYLSYEHFFTIDTTTENLSKTYKDTIQSCVKDEKFGCTILDSRISTGKYPSAQIRLRLMPGGVKSIISVASVKGIIVQESTHIEDLAKPIVDNKQRLDMLESHRKRLLALQEKAAEDIESLIKLSSELSKVQSEIELAKGENAFLHQRVSMDIVNLNFQVEFYRSFWRPIRESLSDFSNNFSDGISGTIIVAAYLLPGFLVLLVVFFGIRFVWRKMRRNK